MTAAQLENREGRELVAAIHERKRKADMTDQLAAIEARANDPFGTSLQGIGQVDADRDSLLAIIRTQQARIDSVLDLANTRSRCGWQISADEIRKALKG